VPANLEDLESVILERMSKTEVPGLSIAVVEGDRSVFARGLGFGGLLWMHACRGSYSARKGRDIFSQESTQSLCQNTCAA